MRRLFCIFIQLKKHIMKEIYISLLILTAFIFNATAQVPTCSLNPTFIASTKNGIWPDSVTNFMQGTVGVPYIQNITVKVPKDTVSVIGKMCFNRFVLSTPTGTVNYGLPPGLYFGSSTAAVANGTVNGAISLKFPGNANNYASIYGTPTTAGTYTLHLKVDAFATPAVLSGGNCPTSPNVSGGTNVSTQQLNYYIIKINAPSTGLVELGKNSFNLSNVPNPFTNKTTFKFFVLEQGQATITVHNVLGKQIFEAGMTAEPGDNQFEFDGSSLSEGTYFYTIKFKNFSETKRMILYGN